MLGLCTSNIGSGQLLRATRLPFTTLERAVISDVFRPICPDTQREIARLAVAEELIGFRERGFNLVEIDKDLHPQQMINFFFPCCVSCA